MAQGGAFEKIRDQKMIQTLTGAHMSSNGTKHQVTFDVLDPSEARGGPERCRMLRDYALSLESPMAYAAEMPMACAAETDDEADEEATKHKRAMAKEAAEEIMLKSALRGAASSGDTTRAGDCDQGGSSHHCL